MSTYIEADSQLRGCAAHFAQPVDDNDRLAAEELRNSVYHFNCRVGDLPLADIEYRSSSGEGDILRHVFRWDRTPYEEVFQNGFQVRRQDNTPDEVYFNLDHFVHHSGRPLDSRRSANHAFLSTTLNGDWCPTVSETLEEVYRYEIYAPGGIWVAETLGDRYQYRSQDEVCFVAGIAPQYIRAAQRFRIVRDGRYSRRERLDFRVILNGNFNPQSHPSSLLYIRRPAFDYKDEKGESRPLTIVIWRPPAVSDREKRSADNSDTTTNWYAGKVADCDSYIDAGFRSSYIDQAYLFINDEYVLVDYAPDSTNDKVLKGPLLICEGYPSLRGTAFAEHGIDSAFGTSYDNYKDAFIFSGNLCALINYAPYSTDDKIIKGPMTITAMFPFLKNTEFERGIDAAFESTKKYEAYLFKGNQYALIYFGSDDPHLIHVNVISDGFPSLKETMFESGIDAAFASHKKKEAYLFKGDSYARIYFNPGTTDDYIIDGVKKILPNWPSLQPILPRKNRGLDVHHNDTSPGVDDDDRDQDHDEL